jgi:hypothetical protein
MFVDIMDELLFFPIIFNFDMCFSIHTVRSLHKLTTRTRALSHTHTHYLSIYVKSLLYHK